MNVQQIRDEYAAVKACVDRCVKRDGHLNPEVLRIAEYSALMEIALQLAELNEHYRKETAVSPYPPGHPLHQGGAR